MDTTGRIPEPIAPALRAVGAATGPIRRFLEAIVTSPANVLLALGVSSLVLGAIVLRTGVWAAVFGVWGIALACLGLGLRAAVWWLRR